MPMMTRSVKAVLVTALSVLFLMLYYWSTLNHGKGYRRLLRSAGAPPKCFIQPLRNMSELHRYFAHPEAPCKDLKAFGALPPAPAGDMKLMCLDPYYNIQPSVCLVLSFGVGNTWYFEDEVATFGCKVVAFDPTNGLKDHKRGYNIHFYAVGLSNSKGNKLLGMMRDGAKPMVGPVDRYENLLSLAGIEGRVVDFLKINIELSELEFFQDMFFNTPHLLADVKQIAMEVHHDDEGDKDLGPGSVHQQFWTYYQLLRCHGFRLIRTYNHNAHRKWTEVLWGREGSW